LRRSALLVMALALSAFAPPAFAGDVDFEETTATAITSPEGSYFSYYDVSANDENAADDNENGIEDVNEVTISGTANGNDDLGLYCVYGNWGGGGREWIGIASISSADLTPAESGYTWSIAVDKEQLLNHDVTQTCRLQAIPASKSVGSSDLSPFRGIVTGMGIVVASEQLFERATATRGKSMATSDFYASFPQTRGFFAYTSVGADGLDTAAAFSPSTFALADYSTWNRGANQRLRGAASRNDLRIDGRDAYNASSAPTEAEDPDCESGDYYSSDDCMVSIDGQPNVEFSIESFDERTGDVTFLETEDLVRCVTPADESGEPARRRPQLNLSDCPALEPTGVRFERRVVQGRDGRVSSFTDRYVAIEDSSGEITEHAIDVQYQSESGSEEDPTWRLPGETEYAQFDEDDELDLPQSPIGTFIQRDAENNDEPEDTAGPGSLTYTSRPDRAFFDNEARIVLTYRRQIPADGALELTHIFGLGQDKGGIEALAASIEDGLTAPLVAITAPVNGSSTSSQRITATGTASADARLVRVNGRSVPVLSDGTWSADIDLQPGANTVTAQAVDGEGLTAQDARTVTYAAAPQQQQSAASRTAKITKPVSLLSKRMRLKKDRTFRLTIRCVAGGPQSGTIRVRTRGKNARTIAVKAYQCPGGGKRNFSFRMSLETLRSKGIKGRRSLPMTAYVVGEDENGQNILVKAKFTLVLR
jgi:hypothetical protein